MIRVKFSWDVEPGYEMAHIMHFNQKPSMTCDDVKALIPLPEGAEEMQPWNCDGFVLLIDSNHEDKDWGYRTASVSERYFIDVWYALVKAGLEPA